MTGFQAYNASVLIPFTSVHFSPLIALSSLFCLPPTVCLKERHCCFYLFVLSFCPAVYYTVADGVVYVMLHHLSPPSLSPTSCWMFPSTIVIAPSLSCPQPLQVACFLLSTSSHIPYFHFLWAFVISPLCSFISRIWKRSFHICFPLTNFSQQDTRQMYPCSSRMHDFISSYGQVIARYSIYDFTWGSL